MKRAHKATHSKSASKSASPSGTKVKRTKLNASQIADKIKKWTKAASTSELGPTSASTFSTKLWRMVDKSDPRAVEMVLQQHLHGKDGDSDGLFFSFSRFWHSFKIICDQDLTYFLLSLWSVLLEARYIACETRVVGDDICAALLGGEKINFIDSFDNVRKVLRATDTVSLALWYEKYFLLRFGVNYLTDNTEMVRNRQSDAEAFGGDLIAPQSPVDTELVIDLTQQEQPGSDGDSTDTENNIGELYAQFMRPPPDFLYVEKNVLEQLPPGDRTIVVLNVLSDPDFQLPVGWSFQPPIGDPSVCIPLRTFTGLGVFHQIEQANEMLTFACDYAPEVSEQGTCTDYYDHAYDNSTQTNVMGDQFIDSNPLIQDVITQLITQEIRNTAENSFFQHLRQQLQSPELGFDADFNIIRRGGGNHICNCLRCNVFLIDFLNAAFDHHYSTVNNMIYEPSVLHYMHTDYNTEVRSQRRSVDMDETSKMSKSSPDLISSDSSSSSSTGSDTIHLGTIGEGISSKGGENIPAKQIVVIPEQGVPINVEQGDNNRVGDAEVVTIYDDDGVTPIVKLAVSPRRAQEEAQDIPQEQFYTPPQPEYDKQHISQIKFSEIKIPIERAYHDILIDSTTWGDSHDVFEVTRMGRSDIIPTIHVTAAILRVLPIIASRAGWGELQAVNAVGLIKSRIDEFLQPARINAPSSTLPGSPHSTLGTAGSTLSDISESKRKRGTYKRKRSRSPPSSRTPDTPSYHPTEGAQAYDRASRFTAAARHFGQQAHRPTRALPRMTGPQSQIGGWYNPLINAPPYVSDYRLIPGWTPGMPRPPTRWDTGSTSGQTRPDRATAHQRLGPTPLFTYYPPGQQFRFGRGQN